MIEEQYKDRYFINTDSLFREYGVIVEKGGYDELMRTTERKQGYTHEWEEYNGTERYILNTFKTQTVSLNFVFVCSTLSEYLTKKEALFSLLQGNNRFELSVTTLGRKWNVLYNNETNVEYLTDIYAGGLVIARHTLTFFNDDVFPTII